MVVIILLSYVGFSEAYADKSIYEDCIYLCFADNWDYLSYGLTNYELEKGINLEQISEEIEKENSIILNGGENSPNKLGVVGAEFVAGSLAGFLWSKIYFPAPSLKTWHYIPDVAGGYSLFTGATVFFTGKLMGGTPSLRRTMIGAFAGGVIASFFIPHREEEYSFKKYWYYETLPAIGAIITDELTKNESMRAYASEFVIGSGVSLLYNFGSYTAVYGNTMVDQNLLVETGRRLPGDILLTATSVHYSAKMCGVEGNLKNAIIGSAIGSLLSTAIFLVLKDKNPPSWTENDFVEYSAAISWSIAPAIGAIIGNHWE